MLHRFAVPCVNHDEAISPTVFTAPIAFELRRPLSIISAELRAPNTRHNKHTAVVAAGACEGGSAETTHVSRGLHTR